MHTINLMIGDWSGDGHEKFSETRILCNLTSGELHAAFEEGEKIIGIRFADQFSDYEANKIPIDMIQKMSKFFDTGYENIEGDDDDISIYDDEYVDLWLKIAKVGNPEMVFEYSKPDSSLNIGGYGLFW